MTPAQVREISCLLHAASGMSGVPIVWKNATGGGEPGVPDDQCLHCNDFCVVVKRSQERVAKCSENDCVKVKRRAEAEREPFFHECHAGALELIIPIFIDGAYAGSIYFGPFKGEGEGDCPYKPLRKEYDKLQYCPPRLAESAKDLFSILVDFIIEQQESGTRERFAEKTRDDRIVMAMAYIDRHFKRNVTVADVSGKCGLSASRFIHLFKEELELGFSEYLQARRMEEAKTLLKTTTMKIVDVALECGYANQCYFGLVFKRNTGFSPGVYRKEYGRPIQV